MKLIAFIWLSLMILVQAGKLEFKEMLTEVHAAADAENVTADFEFTNKSDKPVTIAKYQPSCHCIGVKIKDGKLRYAPGESGLLRAEFDMGNFAGVVDKSVAIWLDNDSEEKPSVNLTVRVHIPVLVSIEPKTLKWDLGGKAEPQTIKITMNHSKPIKVISVDCSQPKAFDYPLKTIEDGKSYELTVTPHEVNSPALAIFRIETDCKMERHRIQQAFAVIRKPSPAEMAAKK